MDTRGGETEIRSDALQDALLEEIAAPVRTARHILRLFPEMEPLLQALRQDIEGARREVWVATYIYRDDSFGQAFGDMMAQAAARGADVRLLYDPLGSQRTPRSFFRTLRKKGVQVRAYRPFGLGFLYPSFWARGHSRIIVLDGAGYTGGAALGDEWLPRKRGGGGWHDVSVRVEGPCLHAFRSAFLQRWEEAVSPWKTQRKNDERGIYPDVDFISDSADNKRIIFQRYRESIQRARARVWIENAYFLPPRSLLSDLYAAAARGVDVRLLLPGETDLPRTMHAARTEYEEWMARGLKIYEYEGSVLHSKCALIDDYWATIGSLNLLIFNLRWSDETNLFVYDSDFARKMEMLFQRDFARSRRLSPGDPPGRSLLDRIQDNVLNRMIRAVERL